MGYIIRNAEYEDISDILDMENSLFSMPHTREQLVSCLDRERHIFPVAVEDGGKVIGYAEMTVVIDEGYISNVAVSESFRRHGIAKNIINNLAESGANRSLSFMTLEVRESNDAAIKLYEGCNFSVAAVRKNYYTEPKENALIMTRYFN